MSRFRFVRWSLLAACLFLFLNPTNLSAQVTVNTAFKIAPKRGICILLGDVEPKAAIRLARQTEAMVYVQYAKEAQVTAARQAAEKTGLLGTRLYFAQGDPATIHLADDLADAVFVVGDVKDSRTLRRELLRVLHPGASAYLGNETITEPFAKTTDEWRHPYRGADNNPQSTDEKAKGPFLTHFMAEPWYAAMPQMSVISGGRIFKVFGNRSSKQPSWDSLNTMICINAYNGATLWRKKLKAGFLRHRNTLVATPDTLYFGDDVSCQLIDPATGKTRDEITVPADIVDGPVWSWMALQDGVLYALIGKKEPKVEVAKWRDDFRGAGWPWWKYKDYDFGFGRTIVAIDPKSKKVLWHHREKEYLDMRAMCMTKDRIYFYSDQKFLGCLDARSGKVIWKSTDPKMLQAIGAHSAAQNPYFGFITTSYVKCSDKGLYFAGPMRKNIVGVSTKDGTFMWQQTGAGNSQLVVRDEAVYALGGGRRNEALSSMKIHPISGKVLAKFASRDRCTRATGCIDAIFTRGGRGGSTAVFDVKSTEPKMDVLSPMRPACQDGVTIAHGYLFWGPWMCRCDSTQIGVIALGPAGGFKYDVPAKEGERLKVDADNLNKVEAFAIAKNDWPAYRRDNARTSRSPVAISRKVQKLWTFSPVKEGIKNAAAAPVAAGGLIYSSGADGAVRAHDAKTGKVQWTTFTGGAIKYPPAVSQNRLYVGSGDGYVYCLEAKTGRRLWRFQAAPTERRIPVFGSLISTWPVGGGVIVDKGIVYAAAGNANYNGTHVYALDAVTGKIRWQNNDSGHRAASEDSGAGVQGHLLLHDKHLWMQGGNLTGVVSYDIETGKFQRRGTHSGRYGNLSGKDLYVLNGKVQVSGLPLYFRPEDSHFIERCTINTPSGLVAVFAEQVALVDPKSNPKKPKGLWKQQPFHENNAVAVGKNAVIIAGVHRKKNGETIQTTSGICALDLKTGKELWRQPLPAQPVSFGTAIDRDGRVVVALQDGRVVCFGG